MDTPDRELEPGARRPRLRRLLRGGRLAALAALASFASFAGLRERGEREKMTRQRESSRAKFSRGADRMKAVVVDRRAIRARRVKLCLVFCSDFLFLFRIVDILGNMAPRYLS